MSPRLPHRRSLTIAIAALLTGSACRSTDPVRIGVVLSEDGAVTAALARDEINASGGIHGRPLELVVMDSAQSTGAAAAIAAAESLTADPTVYAVVGHTNSSATLAASQIYNSRRLVHLAPTSSAPLLAQAGPYTYQLVASDVHQAEFLADALLAGGARPRTALLFVNDDYGRGLQQALRQRMTKAGVTLTYEAPVSDDSRQVNAALVASAVANSKADVLIWIGRAGSLERVVPHLRRLQPSIRVLASDGVENATSVQNRTGVLTGVQYVRFIPLHFDTPKLDTLGQRFAARSPDVAMMTEAVLAYDAVMLLAEAMRATSVSRDQVRRYLEDLGRRRPSFVGVTGSISFDSTGAARPRYVLTEIGVSGLRAVAMAER